MKTDPFREYLIQQSQAGGKRDMYGILPLVYRLLMD